MVKNSLYERNEGAQFEWIRCMQGILQSCGLYCVWLSQKKEYIEWVLCYLDKFQQKMGI